MLLRLLKFRHGAEHSSFLRENKAGQVARWLKMLKVRVYASTPVFWSP